MPPFLIRLRHLSLKAVASSFVYACGLLWLVVEVTAFFSKPFAEGVKPFWWLFLASGLVIGLVRAFPRLSVRANVARTDCHIELRVCDMMSLKDVDFIVGANTTFDTALEDGTISPHSVQGQFTKKFAESVEHLDREIAHSLAGEPSTPVPPGEKPYGKQQRYAIGTTATVQASKRRAYFVAIATLNAHRGAQSTRQDVQDALPRLWEYVRNRGGLDPLCCPILGSGFSRLDTTREELIHEIIRSFIPAVRAGLFCRSLIVAVSPRDFGEGRLDLKRLENFLNHECTYG